MAVASRLRLSSRASGLETLVQTVRDTSPGGLVS